MKREYFKNLEKANARQTFDLHNAITHLAFNEQGLVPVVTQDFTTNKVLMLAWMNEEALRLTLNNGRMTYWSRSRKKLWVKGESSGHFQSLVCMQFDCDGDAILCKVHQEGAACHTGRPHCFYLNVNVESSTIIIEGNQKI